MNYEPTTKNLEPRKEMNEEITASTTSNISTEEQHNNSKNTGCTSMQSALQKLLNFIPLSTPVKGKVKQLSGNATEMKLKTKLKKKLRILFQPQRDTLKY